jgi:hypothetical protein
MPFRFTPASRRWLATLLIWLQLLLPLLGSFGSLMVPGSAAAQGLSGSDMGEFCTMASLGSSSADTGGTGQDDGSRQGLAGACALCCACSHQQHHGSAMLLQTGPRHAVAAASLSGRAGVDQPAPAHVSAPERHRAARAPPAPAVLA